jgi:hypothetical protein
MLYQVMHNNEIVATVNALRSEQVVLQKVREPSALGNAPYDPLIDIAYEMVKKGQGRQMDHELIARVGGMEHVEAMRAQVRL